MIFRLGFIRLFSVFLLVFPIFFATGCSKAAGDTEADRSAPAAKPLNTSGIKFVDIEFNEPIEQESVIEGAVELIGPDNLQVPGHPEYINATTIRFQPDQDLSYQTTYTIKIGNLLTDLAGNRMVPAQLVIITERFPELPAQIAAVNPDILSVNQSVFGAIEVRFKKALAEAGNESAIVLKDGDGTAVFGKIIAVSSDQLRFVADSKQLLPAMAYTVQISKDLKFLDESVLGVDFSWRFTTKAAINWAVAFGQQTGDRIEDIIEVADGYVAVGYTNVADHQRDGWIVKMNASGKIAWNHRVGGGANEQFYKVRATADGGFLVAGKAQSFSANSAAWLVKYNRDEMLQWSRIYDTADGDSFEDFIELESGFLAVGASAGLESGKDAQMWVIQLNTDGSKVSAYSLGAESADVLYAVAPAQAGAYVVAGYVTRAVAGSPAILHKDAYVAMFNAKHEILWQHLLGMSGDDEFTQVVPHGDNFLVLGKLDRGNGALPWLLEIDAAGNLIKDVTIGDPGDMMYGLTTLGSDIVLAGTIGSQVTNSSNAWAVKLNSDFSILAQPAYGTVFNSETLNSVKFAADGGLIMAGYEEFWNSNAANVQVFKTGGLADVALSPQSVFDIYASSFVPSVVGSVVEQSAFIPVADAVSEVAAPAIVADDSGVYLLENFAGATGVIGTPSMLTAATTENPNEVLLNWNDTSEGESGFVIFRRRVDSSNTNYRRIERVAANQSAYVDGNLVYSGATYQYKVVSFNQDGYSEFSNETPPLQIP